MHFSLFDRIIERTDTTIVTLKQITRAEEYLQDHFATYPVLPGVLMLEAMVQTGRALLEARDPSILKAAPFVLGRVRTLKYGTFVRPGYAIRIEAQLQATSPEQEHDFRASVRLLDPASGAEPVTACMGRFTLRPARVTVTPVHSGPAKAAARTEAAQVG
jgi:3-hydroxymyristoyl/3-hydroxydecanoyl-(acyl carrier protein) dehydratase